MSKVRVIMVEYVGSDPGLLDVLRASVSERAAAVAAPAPEPAALALPAPLAAAPTRQAPAKRKAASFPQKGRLSRRPH